MKHADRNENQTGASRYRIAKRVLLFWTLFIGIGALWGAICMWIDPTGGLLQMEAMLPYFQKLPFSDLLFRDYTFSGIALLIVNGMTNFTAAVLLMKNRTPGIVLGGIFGVTLMLWICIQFYLFPINVLSVAYFVFGFCQAMTGYAAYIFRKQEAFSVDPTAYRTVGTDSSKLVVYFSRMGYTKKIAYEQANATGADIYEIKATERTSGTLGFWWCGRYGMHRWNMPIEHIGIDLSAYDEVTVCSPIWVFSLAAPVRTFFGQAKGKLKIVNYVFVHYTNGTYETVAKEADRLLGMQHQSLMNIRCRAGNFRMRSGCGSTLNDMRKEGTNNYENPSDDER